MFPTMMECLVLRKNVESKKEIIVKINEIQYLLEREFERTRNPELIELYNSFGVLAEKVIQVL